MSDVRFALVSKLSVQLIP